MNAGILRRHDNSVGIALPADTSLRIGFALGQELTLIERADGITLVKRSLVLERALRLARAVLRDQADALLELAKV